MINAQQACASNAVISLSEQLFPEPLWPCGRLGLKSLSAPLQGGSFKALKSTTGTGILFGDR